MAYLLGEKSMKKIIVILNLISALAWADSATDVQIGAVTYGGNGCPVGSAIVGNSTKGLDIKFSSYQTKTGQGKSLDRKSCNLAIPVTIPKGISVAISPMTFQGSAQLAEKTTAQVNVSVFFVGQPEDKTQETFYPRTKQDIQVTAPVQKLQRWTPCSSEPLSTNLRVNSSLLLRTESDQSSIAKLDVALSSGEATLLQIRKCE